MKAYSNDLRKRIIATRNNGDKVNDITERFSVSVRFIYSLLRLFRMTGSYEAKKNSGGAPRKISSEDEKKPDLTLEKIKEQGNLEVRLNGKTESLVYKNSLTGDFFKQWVKEALCPSLKPNDIVIMDNLSCHKVKGLRELIEQKGILKKLKCRSEEKLFKGIAEALSNVSKSDALGWFNSSGY